MPITQEENDKIQEGLEAQIEDQTPPEDSEKGNPKEDKTEVEESEESKPYWAQAGFKSEADFVKSYENAQSTIGKQGTELGELRAKVKAQPEEKPVEEPEPEFDPYDKESLETHVERKVREAMEAKEAKRKADEEAARAEEDRLKMVGNFIQTHQDELSEDKMKEVATFARDNKIYDLEHAYLVMNANNKTHSKPESKSELGKQVNELPNTLTDVGAGGKEEKTLADVSQDEWGSTPEEQRKAALRNAPSG